MVWRLPAAAIKRIFKFHACACLISPDRPYLDCSPSQSQPRPEQRNRVIGRGGRAVEVRDGGRDRCGVGTARPPSKPAPTFLPDMSCECSMINQTRILNITLNWSSWNFCQQKYSGLTRESWGLEWKQCSKWCLSIESISPFSGCWVNSV